jgi:uncharacterized protein YjbJ (UPF0337 family)
MSGPSKTSGYTDQVTGSIKETTGKVLGNEQMQAEGLVTRKKGEGEVEAARLQQQAVAKGEQWSGSIKDTVGGIIGNEKMQTEGKIEKAKGDIRQASNEKK